MRPASLSRITSKLQKQNLEESLLTVHHYRAWLGGVKSFLLGICKADYSPPCFPLRRYDYSSYQDIVYYFFNILNFIPKGRNQN